jgi:hypothetical protein
MKNQFCDSQSKVITTPDLPGAASQLAAAPLPPC